MSAGGFWYTKVDERAQNGDQLARMLATQNAQISLAPAAGAGIGKMLFDLLLADPEFLPAMKRAAMGGLEAMRSFYDPGSKCVVSEIDSRTRMQALGLILAQAEGEPIKRVIHQHLGASGELDLLGAVRDSPQMQEQLRALLEKATWQKSGRRKAKVAEPAVDVGQAPTVEFE